MEKIKRKNLYKAVVAFAVALAFILPTATVLADDDTIVRFEPPTQIVEKGDVFTASVYVEPADYVTGVNFVTISFDPTLLQANSVTEGDLFGGSAFLFEGGTIDNVAGTISDGYALVQAADSVIDPGSIFVIEFTAQNTLGTSDLLISGVTVPGNSSYLDYEVQNGSVTVEEYFDLTIGVNGLGTTVPTPGVHTYTSGEVVNLEAIADPGWSFDHWDGDVADPNTATTTITMLDLSLIHI